jgi:hypothetical protein
LVAGPKVYICDQCVALAIQIMQGHSGDTPQPPEPQRDLWKRLWNRIGRRRNRNLSRPSECHALVH